MGNRLKESKNRRAVSVLQGEGGGHLSHVFGRPTGFVTEMRKKRVESQEKRKLKDAPEFSAVVLRRVELPVWCNGWN